jgi:hypothetical protein
MPRDFRFLTTRPAAGWTAATISQPRDSVTGAVNAMAQNPVTASDLRTTPSTLADSSLGSRRFVNPNTGIRDVAVDASVYAQPSVPAFLSQAVSSLNAEQALRRSLQAEWNDKLMRGAMGMSGTDPYVWMEALRAASVNPGSSVAFGQAIQDPNQGKAALARAQAQAQLDMQKAHILNAAQGTARELGKSAHYFDRDIFGMPKPDQGRGSALTRQASFLTPIATSAAGGSPGWFSSYY